MAASEVEAKFSGTWLQDEVTGDVTDWLKFENVGMIMRQVMWATGYGKGKVTLSLLIKDGAVYNLSELDENFARFRFQFRLDGNPHAFLFSEGVPFMPFRNFVISAKLDAATGKIETDILNDQGSLHSKSSRYVSGDGQKLHTDITFYGDREIHISVTHKRTETTRLTLEDCQRWCPNVQVGDASAAAGGEKVSAVSLPLEEHFADAAELLALALRSKRRLEGPDGGGAEGKELIEEEDGAFTVAVTKPDGSERFAHRCDEAEGRLTVDYSKDGKAVGTWHLSVLKEPLRLECWTTLADPFVSSVCALTEVQNTLDAALRLKREGSG